MKKPRLFTIYKHSNARKVTIWEVHRRYPTMRGAMDALKDLIKQPKSSRDFVYIVLPTVDDNARFLIIKEEARAQELLKAAR